MPMYSAPQRRKQMPLSTSPHQNIESQVKTALEDELRRYEAHSRAQAMHGAMWDANDAQRVALGAAPLGRTYPGAPSMAGIAAAQMPLPGAETPSDRNDVHDLTVAMGAQPDQPAPIEHAPLGAMAPSDARALVDSQRGLDYMDNQRLQELKTVLGQIAGGNDSKMLEYGNARLRDQPWFDQATEAGRLLSHASDEQRGAVGSLPGIKQISPGPLDPSFERFRSFYSSPEQQARRANAAARKEEIAQSPRIQRAMAAADMRENPQAAILKQLQGEGAAGAVGGIGLPQMAAMQMMGMGEAVPAALQGQAALAQVNAQAAHEQGQLALQKQLGAAQAAQGGLTTMIPFHGGVENLPPGTLHAEILKSLASNGNNLDATLHEMQGHGITEELVKKALGGRKVPKQTGWLHLAGGDAKTRQRLGVAEEAPAVAAAPAAAGTSSIPNVLGILQNLALGKGW